MNFLFLNLWNSMIITVIVSKIQETDGCLKKTLIIRNKRLGAPCCEDDIRENLPVSGSTSSVFKSDSNSSTDSTITQETQTATETANQDESEQQANRIADFDDIPGVPFVGDCKCGTQVTFGRSSEQINRPWAVHISIRTQENILRECSGSLINRNWVLSAAHCFCYNLPGLSCEKENQGKEKESLDIADGTIVLRFGTTSKAKSDFPEIIGVEKVAIHPSYWQAKDSPEVHSYDLSLIKTSKEVYEGDGWSSDGIFHVQPICLPPPGPINHNMMQGSITNVSLEGSAVIAVDKNFFEPLKDVDCDLTFQKRDGVPEHIDVEKVGFLICHPGTENDRNPQLSNAFGTHSFLTAFASTKQAKRGICKTNAMSPDEAIYKKCSSKCEKMLPNPSMSHKVCRDFREQSSAEIEDGIVRYVIKRNDTDVFCYPYKDHSNFIFNDRKPFETGWCHVDCKGNNCEKTDPGWGWCIKDCDNLEIRQYPDNVKESPIDTFAYEKCSIDVNLESEFCSGFPIKQPSQKVMIERKGGKFTPVSREASQWHKNNLGWNGNGTIIRSGAKYQGRQHTSLEGDMCYGFAGGSIWKLHNFRDPNSASSDRPIQLAVLTGVLSRFEANCGEFEKMEGDPDEPNLPTQHTISSRVQLNFDWIVKTAYSEPSCNVGLNGLESSNMGEDGQVMRSYKDESEDEFEENLKVQNMSNFGDVEFAD